MGERTFLMSRFADEAPQRAFSSPADVVAPTAVLRAGAAGGLVGGVCIWIYEAVIWVGAQGQMPLAGIPRNAVGLVFGKEIQESLGFGSYLLGTAIHFFFAILWGVLFAAIWPFFRRRGVEATLLALFYAVFAWIVMHAAITIVSTNHPNYYDPSVIIGGVMSHVFFTTPLALVVKRALAVSPR
jgi:predicted anti-sigma-YlaC factor YlaD